MEGRGVGNKRREICLFSGIVREQNFTWVDAGVNFFKSKLVVLNRQIRDATGSGCSFPKGNVADN